MQSQICFYLFFENCNSSILEVTYKQTWIIFYLLLKSSNKASKAVKAISWLVRIKGHVRMTFYRQTLLGVRRRKVVFIRMQNCFFPLHLKKNHSNFMGVYNQKLIFVVNVGKPWPETIELFFKYGKTNLDVLKSN